MNKAVNTYWTDSRLDIQRPSARTLTLAAAAHSGAVTGGAAPRAVARRLHFTIPSWVLFYMITLATFAICVTVTVRTHAEMRAAEEKFVQISRDVENLRNTNASIRHQVENLRTDPRAIEAAARTRLNMVRAHEIVVPIE